MISLLLLPFKLLNSLLSNPVMLRWVLLPLAVVGALVHFAPPQFWPLFRLYAFVEVALVIMQTAGK